MGIESQPVIENTHGNKRRGIIIIILEVVISLLVLLAIFYDLFAFSVDVQDRLDSLVLLLDIFVVWFLLPVILILRKSHYNPVVTKIATMNLFIITIGMILRAFGPRYFEESTLVQHFIQVLGNFFMLYMAVIFHLHIVRAYNLKQDNNE